MSGAGRIVCVDINPDKFEMARMLGATDFVNPRDYDQHSSAATKAGVNP